MELIAVENSRLVNLFLARRLVGQLYLPEACQALVHRYKFAGFPQSLEQMNAVPVAFSHGKFADTAIEDFNIFGDGVSISARAPTDALDDFLADVTTWSKSELGLDRIESHSVSKIYESHVVFRTKHNILRAVAAYTDVAKQISAGLKKATNQLAVFEPFGFTLAADSAEIHGLKPIPFRLERKSGIEFPLNYYYSSAPLRTKEHLAVLQKLTEASE